MTATKPQPIATAPRDGKVIFAGRGQMVARAFWTTTCHGEGWHTVAPEHVAHLVDPLPFVPTHWSDDPATFLPESVK